jgi:hypothetical protein
MALQIFSEPWTSNAKVVMPLNEPIVPTHATRLLTGNSGCLHPSKLLIIAYHVNGLGFPSAIVLPFLTCTIPHPGQAVMTTGRRMKSWLAPAKVRGWADAMLLCSSNAATAHPDLFAQVLLRIGILDLIVD